MGLMFDVALSFAGSERDYARAIALIVKENGLSVFLDELYEAELWGQNLVESLADIYENKARYCLIIVSKGYCERVYTNVERRAALERAIRNKAEYILPVIVDESWIQGLPRSTAYLDLRKKSVLAISEVLIKKVRGSAPKKLRVPKDLHISRPATTALGAEEFANYLIELCDQSKRAGVVAFGCIVYDEQTAEVRKLLKDTDYWDALDLASGPNFEVFAVKDKVLYGVERAEASDRVELMRAVSFRPSQSQGYYFSRILKEYFGEEKTQLAYPSLVVFLVEDNRIAYCRLIPLSRGTVEETFLRLQQVFTEIASAIEEWRRSGGTSATQLWDGMKARLQKREYTIYIQRAPAGIEEAAKKLASFVDPER